jgi:ATP-binding cassette subfamily C protein
MELRAFARLLRLLAPREVATYLAFILLGAATEGVGLLMLVPLIEVATGRTEDTSPFAQRLADLLAQLGISTSMATLLLTCVALIALRSVVERSRELRGAHLHQGLVDGLRDRCFAAVVDSEWRWIAGRRSADLASLLLADVTRVGTALNQALALVACLALLALGGGGIVGIVLFAQRQRALRLGQGLSDANRRMQRTLQDNLAGIKLTKIIGREREQLADFRAATQGLRENRLRFVRDGSNTRALLQTGAALLLAGFAYVGLTVLRVPVSELLALVVVFARMIPLLVNLHRHHEQWLNCLPALVEIEQVMAECAAAADSPPVAQRTRWPVASSISLDGVTVRHPGRQRPALDNVSLVLPARTTTAIIGASGAGKTTVADVLMGILTPDAGVLRIDGEAVDATSRRRWRHSVAYVPQDTFLFNDSIRNNLCWGALAYSDEQLVHALRRAACDFVFDLPLGLDTLAGDGGRQFSGGERQRIALARALLEQPSLLILDEATSALDPVNEATIRRAVDTLHGDITVVLIGHRDAMLEHADQVLELADGNLVAARDASRRLLSQLP